MATPVTAGTLTLVATGDATLIEHPEGALANGSGSFFFVGRTSQFEQSIRRGLVRFDVAHALPPRAIVERVELTLHMSPSNPGPRRIGVHRVLADWAEGPSSSVSGGGAPAEPGDVTWLHTFWDTATWVRAGGQFLGRASAELVVGAPGSYTWTTTEHLVQDVRLWQAAPSRNFGWFLVGDETLPQTAKSFASREHPDPELLPQLEIVYRLPGAVPHGQVSLERSSDGAPSRDW